MGCQTQVDLLDSFLRLSLLRQCPATWDRTVRYPVRKTLCRGEANSGFGVLLDCLRLQAVLMEQRRKAQGKTQTKGVRNLLRQRHRLLVSHQPLVRIAKIPQRPGGKA